MNSSARSKYTEWPQPGTVINRACGSWAAKQGFVLLPRRWVVERSFGWLARFRRLARDYERLPTTLAGLHFLTFAILMLKRMLPLLLQSS